MSDPSTLSAMLSPVVEGLGAQALAGGLFVVWFGVAQKTRRIGAQLLAFGAFILFFSVAGPPGLEIREIIGPPLTLAAYLLILVGSFVEGRRIIADHAALRAAERDKEQT